MGAPQVRGRVGAKHRRQRELVNSGRTLLASLSEYRQAHGSYPSNENEGGAVLDTQTLEPLHSGDHLPDPGKVTRVLEGDRISLYASPDIPSRDHDYWAVLVHRQDPRLQAVIADTLYYPGREGERLHGLYLVRGADLVPMGAAP